MNIAALVDKHRSILNTATRYWQMRYEDWISFHQDLLDAQGISGRTQRDILEEIAFRVERGNVSAFINKTYASISRAESRAGRNQIKSKKITAQANWSGLTLDKIADELAETYFPDEFMTDQTAKKWISFLDDIKKLAKDRGKPQEDVLKEISEYVMPDSSFIERCRVRIRNARKKLGLRLPSL
jgi:hypothetical protein